MHDYISLEGPVELVDGRLMIRIPLEAGGSALAPLIERGAAIVDGLLCVEIEPGLAEHLRVKAGSLVVVDNKSGFFAITRSDANDHH